MVPVKLTGPIPQSLLDSKPDISTLRGQSIFITGGAAGFGAALARQCAETGAYVTFGDIKVEDGQKLAETLQSEGHNANFIKCDVTSWQDQVAAFKAAVRYGPEGGRLDHIIINAGTTSKLFFTGKDEGVKSLEEDPPELDVTPVEVNLKASLYTLKLAQLYLTSPVSGSPKPDCSKSVLVTASPEAYASMPATVIYTSSKFGARGMFRSSREMFAAKGIRVNQIAPWAMDTQIGNNIKPIMALLGMEFRSVPDHVDVAMHLLCSRHANEDESFGPVGKEENQIAGRSVALGQGGVTMDLGDDQHGGDGGPKITKFLDKSFPGTRQRLMNGFLMMGFQVDKELEWIF